MPERRARFLELLRFLIPGLGSRTCESRARARMSIATPGALAQGAVVDFVPIGPLKSQKTGQFQGEACGVNASNQ